MAWELERFAVRLAPAVQLLGLEFSDIRKSQLPNGKSYQYEVDGVRYELYKGLSASALTKVGPICIDLGFAGTYGYGKEVINLWSRFGTSRWVNDLFELRALAGYQWIDISRERGKADYFKDLHIETRHKPSLALEVSAPFSLVGGLTLSVSTTFSHDAILALSFDMTVNPIQAKIIREESGTALVQAQQTFEEAKAAVSIEAIRQSADSIETKAPQGERRLQALRNALFYMTLPNYPWEGKTSFKNLLAKARGEAVFAHTVDPQEDSEKLIREIDYFPVKSARILATELSGDQLGMMKWLSDWAGSLSSVSALYPERIRESAIELKSKIEQYRQVMRDLGKVCKNSGSNYSADRVLDKLESIEKQLDARVTDPDLNDPTQILLHTAREYSPLDRVDVFRRLQSNFNNRVTEGKAKETAEAVVAEYARQSPKWLRDKVEDYVTAHVPYSLQLQTKNRLLSEIANKFPEGVSREAADAYLVPPQNPAPESDTPFYAFLPATVSIENGPVITRTIQGRAGVVFKSIKAYCDYIEPLLRGIPNTNRHDMMARRQHYLQFRDEAQGTELERFKKEVIQSRIQNLEVELRAQIAKDMKDLSDMQEIPRLRRDIYKVKDIFSDPNRLLDTLDAIEKQLEGKGQ